MWKPLTVAACLFALTACTAPKAADDDAGHEAPHAEAIEEAAHHDGDHDGDAMAVAVSASYPIDVCTFSGEPLPAEGYATAMIEGRELRYCCPSCAQAAASDPAGAMAEFQQAVKDSQRDAYPIDTCIVSGEALGSMGDPVELLVGDRLVRVCCAGCKGMVDANGEELVAKLDAIQ